MRFAILLLVVAGCALSCAPARPPAAGDAARDAAPAGDVTPLLNRVRQLNDRCRGGSGDDPATMKACDERDVVVKQLEARGWCFGRPDQIEADKKWEKCAPQGR